jgi:hypothetical protein
VTQRTVCLYRELENAVPDGLAHVERLLVRRDADTVRVVEVVRHLDPLLAAGRHVEQLARDGRRHAVIVTEHGGIRTAISRDHDVVDAAVELDALVICIPATQLLARHVEFEDRAVLVGARKQERLLPGQRQAVVAAPREGVQHGARLAVPLRE